MLTVDGQMTSYGRSRVERSAVYRTANALPVRSALNGFAGPQRCQGRSPAGTVRAARVLRAVAPIGRRPSQWTVKAGLPVLIAVQNIGAEIRRHSGKLRSARLPRNLSQARSAPKCGMPGT